MKTLSRTFIILLVFVLLAGLMVVSVAIVSAVAVSVGLIDGPKTEHQDSPEIVSVEGVEEKPPEIRNEDEHDKPSVLYLVRHWILSTGKNVFVMAVLVVLIVFPKSVIKKTRKTIFSTNAHNKP